MSLTAHLPPWLSQALAQRLEGVSRNQLALRAEAISESYRGLGDSQTIQSGHDALAYAIVRMPATYAAVRAAMLQAAERLPNFAPDSLLDAGAGPGTALWAAADCWPTLGCATLIDRNPFLLQLAQSLAASGGPALVPNFCQAELSAALDRLQPADLVVASYALAELPPATLPATVERLWGLTNQALLLVEPGTPDGFARLQACRKHLLDAGGFLAAPCTHAGLCPLALQRRWCHFSQRLPRTRDHRLVKSAEVNFEDERYGYLFVTKANPGPFAARRILSTPRITKQAVQIALCAPGAVEEASIGRRDKPAYKAARHYNWGEAVILP